MQGDKVTTQIYKRTVFFSDFLSNTGALFLSIYSIIGGILNSYEAFSVKKSLIKRVFADADIHESKPKKDPDPNLIDDEQDSFNDADK